MNTRIFTWGHLIKFRLGGLFVSRAGSEKKPGISVSELEHLELVRKLKVDYKPGKSARTDIGIEEICIRKW